MSWSREEALTDPAIREPMIVVSEFHFFLRDIPTEIVARLYRPLHSGRIIARRSHDVSIEGAKLPPAASDELEDDSSEGEVLHHCVNEMVVAYNAAKAQLLKPDVSWLKPNKDFR
jgi:hypothetical protein